MSSIMISHKDIEYSEAVDEWIHRHSEKLARADHQVTSSRIRISRTGPHNRQAYRVSLECHVPHHPVAISRVVLDESLYQAIKGVFETMFQVLRRDRQKRRQIMHRTTQASSINY